VILLGARPSEPDRVPALQSGPPPVSAASAPHLALSESDTAVRFRPAAGGTGSVRIRVRTASGAPAVETSIQLTGPTPGTTRTDARGQALFPALLPGRYSVRLAGERALTTSRAVTLGAGEMRSLELAIEDADLSLAGRVRTRAGLSLGGVRVSVQRFQEPESADLRLEPVERAGAETRADGTYAVHDLAAGDYIVRVAASEGHGPCEAVFRAGVRNADLLVAASRIVSLSGTVRGEGGPLADVSVHPFGQSERGVTTDADGRYHAALLVGDPLREHALLFKRADYRTLRLAIPPPIEGDALALDAVLRPSVGMAVLGGRVVTAEGDGVAGQTVYVFASRLERRYRATTDDAGWFRVPDAEVGAGYRLLVRPLDGAWRDAALEDIEVPAEGLQDIELVLRPLGRGTVRLRVVDPAGRPVAGLRLLYRSEWSVRSPVWNATGTDGECNLRQFPAGPLTASTPAWPRFVVRGLEVRAAGDTVARVTFDRGTDVFRGEVVDPAGRPVADAKVLLVSRHAQDEVRALTIRMAHTTGGGGVEFVGVGPGPHAVVVKAAGFAERRVEWAPLAGNPEPIVLAPRE
jgi:hypothetical protein